MLWRHYVTWCQRVFWCFYFCRQLNLQAIKAQTPNCYSSEEQRFIFWFSPLSLSCKLVCLPHTSIGSGDSQRLGMNLNTELRAFFWLSPIRGSFPHSLVATFWAHSLSWFFRPEWWQAFYWNFSHSNCGNPLKKITENWEFTEPLLALHFDSPPKCEKFSLQSPQIVVLYVVQLDQVLPLDFFFFC